MLLGSFRDDNFDAPKLERGALLRSETERRSLDELTSVELDAIFGAAGILLGRSPASWMIRRCLTCRKSSGEP
jgi:hypothetical protein